MPNEGSSPSVRPFLFGSQFSSSHAAELLFSVVNMNWGMVIVTVRSPLSSVRLSCSSVPVSSFLSLHISPARPTLPYQSVRNSDAALRVQQFRHMHVVLAAPPKRTKHIITHALCPVKQVRGKKRSVTKVLN